ncbi:efflux transporter outer membrane subunit [Comamonas guangdongensis]|uniref:Efflux transporter outer membrane subunit n=1 Tax=Comamonas guangdongensis TaxID=510515 RepID=A0ABV3ZP23_9BURK
MSRADSHAIPAAAAAPASLRLGLAAAVLLGGCAVGPDFTSPELPAAVTDNSYTPTPVVQETVSAPGTGGAAQRLLPGRDIPAQWWSLFHSDALDQLIRAALAQSPNLAAAQAALRQAQETLNAQTGALQYPNVGLQLGAQRERANTNTSAGVADFNLYNASVNVGYTLDLFGGNRRALEGLAAAVDYQRFQVEASYLALTSNLVTTAIREASLRAQLQATREVLALQEKQLSVVNLQFNAGAVARSAVLAQRTQVTQTRATVPPLEKALAQTRHQLSVYAGKPPSELGLPEFELDSLQLPQELPLSLPSSLVRQRPDIRANEALLHEASAQVGVATAAQYPQLNLSAGYGTSSSLASQLFTGAATIWSLAAGLTQPIFNGGALSAKKRAAVAAYDQAQAQYQATVLGAFQNVADALRAIESDAQALSTQAQTEALAREALALTNEQYKLGAASYLQLLDAQRTYQQTRIGLVQAQAARYADTAALFQALGGGWWNAPALADTSQPGTAAVTQRPALAPVR